MFSYQSLDSNHTIPLYKGSLEDGPQGWFYFNNQTLESCYSIYLRQSKEEWDWTIFSSISRCGMMTPCRKAGRNILPANMNRSLRNPPLEGLQKISITSVRIGPSCIIPLNMLSHNYFYFLKHFLSTTPLNFRSNQRPSKTPADLESQRWMFRRALEEIPDTPQAVFEPYLTTSEDQLILDRISTRIDNLRGEVAKSKGVLKMI